MIININEISFKDYNMNMLNILFHEKTVYMRKRYLYKQVLEPYSSFFPAVSGKLKVVQLKSQQ